MLQKQNENITLDGILNLQGSDIKKWNTNLSVNEQANVLPYDTKWEFPIEQLKLGNLKNSYYVILFIKITNAMSSYTFL